MGDEREYWLSLDLSSPVGTFAIHSSRPGPLAHGTISEALDQSEKVIGVLEAALKAQRLEVRSFNRFITSAGPGSFTGLRVALATLKAFAYVADTSIETVNGSEARVLQWSRQHVHKSGDRIYVLTYATTDKVVLAEFFLEQQKWSFVSETLVSRHDITHSSDFFLIEERLRHIPLQNATTFPLRAEYLGNTLLDCSSRRTHNTLAEKINLSPNYFGGRIS